MIQITYIKDTIEMLETSCQEETFLDEEDYQILALRILRCEVLVLNTEGLKGRITKEWDWFIDLIKLFYEKMRNDIVDDEEE